MYDIVSAEQYDLTGSEGLGDLVNIFTKKKCLPVLKKEIIQGVTTVEEQIRNQLKVLFADMYLVSEAANRIHAIDALVTEYICARFGLRYDEIDPSLTELERTVEVGVEAKVKEEEVEIKEKKVEVDMPLFAESPLRGNGQWTYRTSITGSDRYGLPNKARHDITFKSPIPPLTPDAKEKAREAEAEFYNIYSKALEDPIVGKWLFHGVGGRNSCGFNQMVYWIPRTKDLEVVVESEDITPDKDPIILANINGRKFLVAAWNVEGEEPYQHYLGAFKL